MRRSFCASVVVGLSLAAAQVAQAQACVGLPSAKDAPVNLSAAAAFPKNAKTFAGRLGFAGAQAFGGASVGYTSYDNLDASSVAVGADIGLALPMNEAKSVQICPQIGGAYISGPNAEAGGLSLTTKQQQYSGTLNIGGELPVNSTFSVIPFASVGVLHARVQLTGNVIEDSANDTGGTFGAGFGLLFSKVFVLAPSISIPFGFSSNDPTFGITASIGFGKR